MSDIIATQNNRKITLSRRPTSYLKYNLLLAGCFENTNSIPFSEWNTKKKLIIIQSGRGGERLNCRHASHFSTAHANKSSVDDRSTQP